MKKLFTTAIVLTFLTSFTSPGLAQLQRASEKRAQKAERSDVATLGNVDRGELRFSTLNAYSDGRGAYLKWSVAHEKDNFGFYIYRIDAKGRHLVSENPVGGSAMQVGEQSLYGTEYSYFDEGGNIGSAYAVEALSTAGNRTSSSIFTAGYINDIATVSGVSHEQRLADLWAGTPTSGRTSPDLSKEVVREIESHPRHLADIDTHRWVISQPGVRVGVRKDGMYRITAAELDAAGFDTETDPSKWQLYLEGVEQAIIVDPKGAFIEFYGRGIDTLETDTRMYFLIEGQTAGKRMASHTIRRFGSTVIKQSYAQTYTYEERINYVNSILNGDLPNFWGRVITSSQVSIPFTLSGIDPSQSDVQLTIRMQGFNFVAHNMSVVLNENTLEPLSGFGRSAYSRTYSIPADYLIDGGNIIKFQAGAGDQNLFDSISISFNRKHIAQDDALEFFTENARGTHLRGFSSPEVRILDLTREDAPRTISNIGFTAMDGAFGADLPQSRPMLLYAFDESAVMSAPVIESFNTELLGEPTHEAQLVIISHKSLLAEAQVWANYRIGQGFSVKVVDVADIVDEFNYGVSSSAAMTSFLFYTFENWQVSPDYVLFVGDASYDPKNYTGGGRHNYVPSKMINTIFSETATDEGIADFNHDGLAEIAVGRIPARTPDVVTHMFNKTVAFENPVIQNMNRGAIFAHDLNDGYDFDGMSQRVRNQLPESVPSVFISRASPTAQADLVGAINEGQYIVNYSGHGTAGAWAASNFFANSTVPQLTNTDHSIFTMLTCLNGYFIIPGDSLSETLVKSDAGAVAAWASAGLTTPDVQEIMALRFYNQLGLGNITRMGDLIMDAKTTIPGGQDVRLSWVLIGDPMLQVRTPAPTMHNFAR